MLWLLLILLLIYLSWCVLLLVIQDRLLFPVTLIPPPPTNPPPAAAIEISRPIGDGQQSVAWFFPAPGASADHPAPLLVFFHGNGEYIDYLTPVVRYANGLGLSVLLPEYRGYGRSGGAPSERGIVDDAHHFLTQTLKRPDVDADRLVYFGRSLGGGVAAQLAARHPPHALALQSTFTSVASFSWRYGVPPMLVRHPFNTDRVLAVLDCPVLVMHGSEDQTVPAHHGRELAEIAEDGRYVEFPCSHNDFPGPWEHARCHDAVLDFLQDAGILHAQQPEQATGHD